MNEEKWWKFNQNSALTWQENGKHKKMYPYHKRVFTTCDFMSQIMTLVSSEPVTKSCVFFGTIIHVIAPLCPINKNTAWNELEFFKFTWNVQSINLIRVHSLMTSQFEGEILGQLHTKEFFLYDNFVTRDIMLMNVIYERPLSHVQSTLQEEQTCLLEWKYINGKI
jgi:hypothetical protein